MPTVDDVASRGVPALLPRHLPHPDADVRWVATSELADPTPFLEGGEILLTTGLETAGWREEWEQYVDRLIAARVAALGLGTGLTHRRVPERLLSACRHRDLNLLEVPKAVTFVAVSRATAELLEQRQRQVAREALQVQRSLVQAARRDDRDALLAALAKAVDGVAATVGRHGEVESGPFGDQPERMDLVDVAAQVRGLRARGRSAASVSGVSVVTEVQPLGLDSRAETFLAVTMPGRPDSAGRSAVTTAVALLGLAIESHRERRGTERALRGRALELLSNDDARSARLLLDVASNRPRVPDRGRFLRASGGPDALADGLLLAESAGLLAAAGDDLVAFATGRRTDDLAARLIEAGLRVGVGGLLPVTEASRSHQMAGHALAETSDQVPLVRWDRLVGRGALALLDQDRAAAFARSFLGPLETPALKRHDLVTTLGSFVRQHGSRAKVADELGVHRNTVRARVVLIEQALDASLDDPQTRTNAWIALQTRDHP